MSRAVEVLHQGRWVAATLLSTRLDDDGWHGLVGWTDPVTREGYYHWCPDSELRDAPETSDAPQPGEAPELTDDSEPAQSSENGG